MVKTYLIHGVVSSLLSRWVLFLFCFVLGRYSRCSSYLCTQEDSTHETSPGVQKFSIGVYPINSFICVIIKSLIVTVG